MSNFFMEKIDEVYDVILQPIDIMYKLTAINNCKAALNIGKSESIGEYYYRLVQDKKEKGVVYTPLEIANYIIENTIDRETLIKNPFLKIADPACGCGNLVIPCFLHLKKLFMENLDNINEVNNVHLSEQDIDKHIVENNLFGFDTDGFAIKILILDLFKESHNFRIENFSNKDFLFDSGDEKLDVFIGNPPYIGQKSMNKEYAAAVKKLYKELYKDKGDLSYCFFGAALNKLNKGGRLTFVTSRYFLESPSGEILRKTLKEFCSIKRIVDFYGVRPFKNIGIDPVIIFLSLGNDDEDIEVIKPLLNSEKKFFSSLLSKAGSGFASFNISKNLLNDKGWILRDLNERTIINKIEKRCFTSLGNICTSYQGIITGCDKAYVVDDKTVAEEDLETELIKPWIKSSSIQKNKVNRTNLNLIYSDLIKDVHAYPNAVRHIGQYMNKLEERRECKNGVRLWYELQWGRVESIFEGEKIVFPYKSSNNRFALDKGSFFSADVYCLKLKEAVPFTYDFLLKILNSKVYEYYFKTFAKKLGVDLYEYYPNNIMKLCMPTMMDIPEDADSFLYEYFQLEPSEISLIEQYAE